VAPKKETDNNKLYASEVLAILVQSSEANRTRLGAADGIDVLLRVRTCQSCGATSSTHI